MRPLGDERPGDPVLEASAGDLPTGEAPALDPFTGELPEGVSEVRADLDAGDARMRRAVRERWAVLGGALLAVLVVAAMELSGASDRTSGWRTPVLSVPLHVWGFGITVLAAALLLQMALSARVALGRERRLVSTAAALRGARAELERLAVTDALTGLFNRRAFFERLGAELRRSARYERPLTLLMLDLDHFKRVNDTHGHPAGDRVLTQSAAAVASSLRASDIVARYGGEELVVLLPETTCAEAEVVAEKLRGAIADQLFAIADGEALHITVSVGVAALERPGPLDQLTPAEAERELVRLADDALYAAKRGGRNRVATASPGAARE
jgi:diguanylate cyclase (GGDEF)-like protein